MTLREQAIEILDIVGGQHEWEFGVFNLPGDYDQAARDIANRMLWTPQVRQWQNEGADWIHGYLEAACLFRDGFDPPTSGADRRPIPQEQPE